VTVRGRKKPIELLFNLVHPDQLAVVTEVNEDDDGAEEDPDASSQMDGVGNRCVPPIRSPDAIRQSCAAIIREVRDSEHIEAILGRFFGENWNTPRLAEIVSTPGGHLLDQCGGQSAFRDFLEDAKALAANVHGVAEVAGWDGGELGYFN
jgi:hypothetical protein